MIIDWTEILLAVITLLGLIVTGVIVPFVKAKTENAKAQLTEKQRENLEYWAGVGVQSAEIYFEETGAGVRKKEEVTEFLLEFVADKGLDISNYQISVLIDAVVENLINKPWEQFTGVKGITREIQRVD